MKIIETARFRKSFKALAKPIKKQTQKQFQLFLKNIFYPSLHTEKLEPRTAGIYSFRINKNFRTIFTFLDKSTIILLDIGPHDIYKYTG